MDEERKMSSLEDRKKKIEAVRTAIANETAARRGKKGFMTPDRKKKLRLLLRRAAAEQLKKEQEKKACERRQVIAERCGTPKNLDDAREFEIIKLIQQHYARIVQLEEDKYDLEYSVKLKDHEINELNLQMSNMRGKFVKPALKKVSKYDHKFAKLQQKAAEFNFRNQLKQVKKKEFLEEEQEKEKEKPGKPEWSKSRDRSEDAEV